MFFFFGGDSDITLRSSHIYCYERILRSTCFMLVACARLLSLSPTLSAIPNRIFFQLVAFNNNFMIYFMSMYFWVYTFLSLVIKPLNYLSVKSKWWWWYELKRVSGRRLRGVWSTHHISRAQLGGFFEGFRNVHKRINFQLNMISQTAH